MKSEIERDVVRCAQRGDEGARAHVAQVCRVIFTRVLGQRGWLGEGWEDLIQASLEVVCRKLPGFGWRAGFETWAIAILLRTRQRHAENQAARDRRFALESDLGDGDGPSVLESVADDRDNPFDHAARRAFREAAADCAGAVPIPLREVWIRHRIWGHKRHEIAASLSLPPGTVDKRIYLVDQRMRDCLGQRGFTAEAIGLGGGACE